MCVNSENCIERTATVARGEAITGVHFPCQTSAA